MAELPTVAVWKDGWLPLSETFIEDQLASLRDWRSISIGYFNIENGRMRADYAPYSTRVSGKVLRKILGTRIYQSQYRALLVQQRALLIHAHFGSGGISSMSLAQDLDIPLVTTFHGQDASSYGSRIPAVESLYQNRLRRLFSVSNTLLPVSEYVADKLLASGAPTEKIHVHYTGTVITPLCEASRRAGILFVGRLIEKKGVSDLLKAVSLLPQGLNRTPVTIVGMGPMEGELRQLAASLGLDIKFIGWRKPGEIRLLMAAHQVFCAPSHTTVRDNAEGFGMVYIEAALQELPTVAYSAGGTREAVEHGVTGFLAPERSISDLATLLRDVLVDDGLALEIGRAARSRAIQKFDILKQTRELELMFDGLVHR